MQDFRRLLIGLDLSADGDQVSTGSRAAALQASWLAERTGAALEFVHSTHYDPSEESPARAAAGAEARRELFGSFVADYERAGLKASLEVSAERPWQALARRAQGGERALVFVGRRNEAADGGSALGGVSRRLLRKCAAPVWVVRPTSELVHERVLAATDLSPVGERVVQLAAQVAQGLDAKLAICHAFQVPLELTMTRVRIGEQAYQAELEQMAQNARERIEACLPALELAHPPELRIACDAPSNLVRAEVERHSVDLVVMGTLSRSGVAGLLVGNTAERLLDRLTCSLLTVKPDDFVSPLSA